MGHERLKHIKDNLLSCIEGQMCNIYEADGEELGNAIDMLKDLEEALYYCTITEAMEGKGDSEFKYQPTQYNNGGRSYNSGSMSTRYNNGGQSGMSYNNGGQPRDSDGQFMSNYSEPKMMRDPWEGRSPEKRRMYMESRSYHVDKSTQLKELEHYVQELSSDIVEMIQEASSEEKQYLEKKLLALASKVGQMK